MPLTFPWSKGLKVEEQEADWDRTRFPNGKRFFDYQHATTGAEILKAPASGIRVMESGNSFP